MSPVVDGPVGEAVVGQVRLLVRVLARFVDVQLDAESGLVAGVQQPVYQVKDCSKT